MKEINDKLGRSIVMLCWFIFTWSQAQAELTLEAAYPTLGLMYQNLDVELNGEDFDVNTRVSMYLDSGNRRTITGSVKTRGCAYDVTVVDDRAYVADGNRGLQVVDISDPTAPVIIGSVDTPQYALGVTVVGHIAYVADGASGLQVINISNPASPQIIGAVDTLGYARGVTVVGDRAYAADADSGLQVINVSNPENPQIIGAVDTPGFANGVTVVGDTAYVADSGSGLQVIDVSNLANLRIIGSVDTPGSADDVTVVGDTAYVADSGSGLQVIDVINPANPQIIGSVDTPGYANDVMAVGDRAYVAVSGSGLQVIDVSNPANPRIIGSMDTPGSARGVTVADDKAYVADGYDDIAGITWLQVIDVSNPTSSQIIGAVDTPGSARGITVVGDRAYVADGGNGGLQVIDVSNPTNPQIIGAVVTPGYANGVAVFGDRACVADGGSGLQVIDVSNPANPRIIGAVDTPGFANGVTVVGDMAYVADGGSGLQVIDVSNPANPRIIGSVGASEYASGVGVKVVGNTAYVAFSSPGLDEGLQVVDVSNPENPQIIGSLSVDFIMDVDVVDDTAYMAAGSDIGYGGLQVVDVSTPENPRRIDWVSTPGNARGVAVVDDTAYVAYDDGLQVIDVSNPEASQIIGSVGTSGLAHKVTVVDDTAYVTAGNGLVITTVPVEIDPIAMNIETEKISLTLPSPVIPGHYTLRVFNNTESDELKGAVSFTTDARMLDSKAIIVAGGGPNAPGDIWDAIRHSADRAYNVLIHEGFDDENIYYLTDDRDNPNRDELSRYESLEWAINSWASDASALYVYFVDHGLRDNFIIHSNGDNTEKLSVHELDDWLDSLQQTLIGPVTFIYDACHSGTFAAKLNPPEGKDRIVITGSSDEPAYFLKKAEDDFDTFSLHFWDQIGSKEGNIGYAFSGAKEKMKPYNQTALINADGNSYTNEEDDYSIANAMTIRRAKRIFLKPLPTIGRVVGEMTLDGDSTATFWVRDVPDAQRVLASIIPPHMERPEDGGPITALDSIELSDSDNDGTYEGTYDGFTMQGSYLVVIEAQASQKIYNYVQDAMTNQIIASVPIYTSVRQMSGTQDIDADRYEEDNGYHQANVITMDDPDAQPHFFHDPADADWVKFFGLTGQTYTISAGNPSKICDAVIELFDIDGATLLGVSDNSGGAGNDKLLNWTCPQDGIYHVKISSANSHFGENVKYDLKINRPIGPSRSALISGRVLEPDRAPLTNVRIFTDSGGSAISDEEGDFFIRNQEGRCVLTLESDHYGTISRQIDVIEGQDNYYEIIFEDGSGPIHPDQSPSGGGGGGGCFINAVTSQTQ